MASDRPTTKNTSPAKRLSLSKAAAKLAGPAAGCPICHNHRAGASAAGCACAQTAAKKRMGNAFLTHRPMPEKVGLAIS
jgi:hypothetical protein